LGRGREKRWLLIWPASGGAMEVTAVRVVGKGVSAGLFIGRRRGRISEGRRGQI
jgi:hypothetical protein